MSQRRQGGALYGPIPVKTETFRELWVPLVHTNLGGNSYGPIIGPYLFLGKFVWTNGLNFLLKFSPTLVLVHGWLFPGRAIFDSLLTHFSDILAPVGRRAPGFSGQRARGARVGSPGLSQASKPFLACCLSQCAFGSAQGDSADRPVIAVRVVASHFRSVAYNRLFRGLTRIYLRASPQGSSGASGGSLHGGASFKLGVKWWKPFCVLSEPKQRILTEINGGISRGRDGF